MEFLIIFYVNSFITRMQKSFFFFITFQEEVKEAISRQDGENVQLKEELEECCIQPGPSSVLAPSTVLPDLVRVMFDIKFVIRC